MSSFPSSLSLRGRSPALQLAGLLALSASFALALTALRLPFLKEGGAWKIDVMALLPYAEVLMRVDRAIKGETQARQVDQLVGKLPSL